MANEKKTPFIDFSHLRGDILGGITAGIVALPLALAFGVSSGLGPSAGLYGAIFIGFFAALFGGTATQISGPTAPMTAVSMLIIAGIIAANDGEVATALPIILSVFMIAAFFQIGLGMLGMGKYIKYIPYPVVSGFMTAIGVIILVTQVLPAIGYYPKEDAEYVQRFRPEAEEVIVERILGELVDEGSNILENLDETVRRADGVSQDQIEKESQTIAGKNTAGVIGALKIMPRALSNINWLEAILAFATIAIIFGFKRITKKVPSTLVALFVVTGAAMAFQLDYRPIQAIPSGLPRPNFEVFTQFNLQSVAPYILTALTLSLLGAIDSLLTSIVADNMTKTRHNPNRELVGQGIGNAVAAFFGGIPGAGATIRTVVNIQAGGITRISGLVAASLLLVVLLALGPVASKIPAAVLAGILITVGIGVMDYKGLKAIPYMPKSEVAIMLVVLVLSSVWNLVYAVGVGLVIACFLFMKTIGDFTASQSKLLPLGPEDSWDDEREFPEKLKQEVFIKHINGPLFFGSTSDFQTLMKQIPQSATVVIVRMAKTNHIDQSGLYAIEDALTELREGDKTILLVGVQKQVRYMLELIDIIPDLVPQTQIFDTFDDCLVWVKQNVADIQAVG